MTQQAMNNLVIALKQDAGLKDDFIYYLPFEDYKNLPDPFSRTTFTVKEVEERIRRYPNPETSGELFEWDIHGRLFTPAKVSLPDLAVVMIHGGAANEYEFIFTPDGPEQYPDLTKVDPTEARVGVAQHIASLGIPVLAISLPGHYSRKPWPSIADRRPEFLIGEIPGDAELKNRLAVYTFRMCTEAIKALVEKNLKESIFMWGHSTGGSSRSGCETARRAPRAISPRRRDPILCAPRPACRCRSRVRRSVCSLGHTAPSSKNTRRPSNGPT